MIKLASSSSSKEVLDEVKRLHLVGVLLFEREALLIGGARILSTDWSQPWVDGLLRMLEGADPIEAERFAERVFLRRIFATGLRHLLEMEDALEVIKRHARFAEKEAEHMGAFEHAVEWQALQREIEDIEPRVRNLELTLGRLAMRLGNRWLWGARENREP